MFDLRRMHYGAWIGILIILISGFAPMISQTLAAKRLSNNHPSLLAQLIQATPLCVFHAVTTGNDMDQVSEIHAVHGNRQMQRMQNIQHDHQNHQEHPASHRNQEACAYCNLFAHTPFLIGTLPQLAAVAQVHHAFIARLGAAFRPHTVAAESRPQPPPLF